MDAKLGIQHAIRRVDDALTSEAGRNQQSNLVLIDRLTLQEIRDLLGSAWLQIMIEERQTAERQRSEGIA